MTLPNGASSSPAYPLGALAPGEPREIEPGFWVLPVPVPFPPGAVNCLAIAEPDGPFEGGWTLVDTGFQDDRSKALWSDWLSGPLAGRPVARLIGTHHHPDHIGLAGWFQSERGAALWMTRTAWLYARMLQLDAWTDPPAEAERFFIEAGYGEAMLARWRKRAALNFSVTVAPMPLGVRTVAEGEVLRLGGADWRVLYGHGHAPDHLVLVRATDGMTIAGDAVLPRITPNIGLYATEPDGDPLGDWMDACARLAIHLGDDQLILPGHGDPFTGARTRLRDIVAKHERGLDRLHAHLSEPRTVVDCFPALYRREITPALEGLATNETRSHLNRLLLAGRATRAKRPDGAWLWRAV